MTCLMTWFLTNRVLFKSSSSFLAYIPSIFYQYLSHPLASNWLILSSEHLLTQLYLPGQVYFSHFSLLDCVFSQILSVSFNSWFCTSETTCQKMNKKKRDINGFTRFSSSSYFFLLLFRHQGFHKNFISQLYTLLFFSHPIQWLLCPSILLQNHLAIPSISPSRSPITCAHSWLAWAWVSVGHL